MTEVWKDIPGYEGRYEVPSFGNIRSLDRVVHDTLGRIRHLAGRPKAVSTVQGYGHVSLCDGHTEKHLQVHRIVAQTFIPNPEAKPEVNHIDGNKLNNRVNNLEWVTSKENTAHGPQIGLRRNVGYTSRSSSRAKHTRDYQMQRCKPVIDVASGRIYRSHRAAADAMRVNPTSVDEGVQQCRPVWGVQLRELSESEKLNYFN